MGAKSNQGRIFWGIVLMVLGVLLLLDRLGRIDFGYIIGRYWPVIFVIIGISILIGSGSKNTGPALFFILFGGFFLLFRMRIFDSRVWHYIWPLAVIGAGAWLIISPGRGTNK